jgi:predicted permease
VLLRALPYPDSERIVQLKEVNEKGRLINFSDPNFFDLKAKSQTLEATAEYNGDTTTVVAGTNPVRTPVYAVSSDFFRVLGVQPALGRTFAPEETRLGSGLPVAIVSYGFWKSLLEGKQDLAQMSVRINDQIFTVVGVMPAGFKFPQEAEIWVPREIFSPVESRTAHNSRVIGRVRSDVSVDSARTEVSSIGKQLRQVHASSTDAVDFSAIPLQEFLVKDARLGLMILLAAVGFLLLVACSNVANMLLAQAASRQKEFAVRAALGATRFRLARQFIIESFSLTLIAGIFGVLLALWGVDLLIGLNPGNLPRADEIGVNARALLFTFCLSLLLAVVIGLAPMLRLSKADVQSMLKGSGREQSANPVSRRLRSVLVVSQVALTLVLLVGAGLLAKSFLKLLHIDPGFRTDGAVTMDISSPFPEEEQQKTQLAQFHESLLERISRIPGVKAVGGINALPMTDRGADGQFLIDNDPSKTGHAEFRVASAGYFEAMGISLLRGRLFDKSDLPDSPHAAVISRALAERVWPDEEPIGQRLQFGNMDGNRQLLQIVGVVTDVREYGLDSKPPATVYASSLQRPVRTFDFSIVVRSPGDPAALIPVLRQTVQAMNSELPVNFRTLEKIFSSSLDSRRFSLVIFGIFAVAALLLAIIGIYGVMSYATSQRTREIGIRMALGARPRNVLSLVMRHGIGLTVLGVVIGTGASLLLTGLMKSLLFDVSATDPAIFCAIALLLTCVALLACYIPARRATKVDPMIVLRYE